jgi:hypothetical protein
VLAASEEALAVVAGKDVAAKVVRWRNRNGTVSG